VVPHVVGFAEFGTGNLNQQELHDSAILSSTEYFTLDRLK
jgi:hypothetical protein